MSSSPASSVAPAVTWFDHDDPFCTLTLAERGEVFPGGSVDSVAALVVSDPRETSVVQGDPEQLAARLRWLADDLHPLPVPGESRIATADHAVEVTDADAAAFALALYEDALSHAGITDPDIVAEHWADLTDRDKARRINRARHVLARGSVLAGQHAGQVAA